jgi:hypothetical protein
MVIAIGRDSSGDSLERGSNTSRHRQPAANMTVTIASVVDKAGVLMELQEGDVTFVTRVAGGERCTCGFVRRLLAHSPGAGGRRFINQQCGRRCM